jgi:Asp-tRNA(Asn)/Glu-tRNA(Gln) amidotransferase A subunit family amidase
MIPRMRDYESYDALGLAELVRKGETSAEALLDEAHARVESRNPAQNAVNKVWADHARAAIRAGLPDGPFRGVPYLLKDLHAQVAGMPLSFGSRLFSRFVSDTDSEITLRYRRAGLVILGRTASPEFGLTATTESVLGRDAQSGTASDLGGIVGRRQRRRGHPAGGARERRRRLDPTPPRAAGYSA